MSVVQKLKGEDRITAPKNKSSIRTIQIPKTLINILKTQQQGHKKLGIYYKCAGRSGGDSPTARGRTAKAAIAACRNKRSVQGQGAQDEIQPSFRQAIPTAPKAEREKQAQTASSGEQAAPHPQPPFPRRRKIARQSRRRFQNQSSVG